MRALLVLALVVLPSAGLTAEPVQDRYGPPPARRSVPLAPAPNAEAYERAAAPAAASSEPYRGPYLTWASRRGGASGGFLQGARAPQPAAAPPSLTSAALPEPASPPVAAPPPVMQAVAPPPALPQSLYSPPPRPRTAAPRPQADAGVTPQKPAGAAAAPPPRLVAQAMVTPSPAAPPASVQTASGMNEPWRTLKPRTTPRTLPADGAAARSDPPPPAAAPAQTQTASAAPARAAPAPQPAAPAVQVAAAAPPPLVTHNAPVRARFYSLHREYGDTPDPVAMPTNRPLVLIGPGEPAKPDPDGSHAAEGDEAAAPPKPAASIY